MPDGRRKSEPSGSDLWTLARTEEEGVEVVLRFRSDPPLGVRAEHFPHLINIRCAYGEVPGGGMPSKDINDQLYRFEEKLDAIEGPKTGFLFLAVTGNGRKEWIWYVSDTSRFMSRLNGALGREEKPLPIEIEAAQDPRWDTWRSVRDASQKAPSGQQERM